MKKIFSISALAFVGVLALASCKKDYTCECTTTTTNGTSTGTAVSSTTIKDTKKSAKASCEKEQLLLLQVQHLQQQLVLSNN